MLQEWSNAGGMMWLTVVALQCCCYCCCCCCWSVQSGSVQAHRRHL